MDKKIKERFGILIRPTGRFELIQLGYEHADAIKDKREMEDALAAYFDGDFEWARNAEKLAYVTRDGAFDEGKTKNSPATYFAGIGRYGDCIVLPKKDGDVRVTWSRAEAYRIMIRMECDWLWYVDWSANPEKYQKKLAKAIKV